MTDPHGRQSYTHDAVTGIPGPPYRTLIVQADSSGMYFTGDGCFFTPAKSSLKAELTDTLPFIADEYIMGKSCKDVKRFSA